MDSSLIILIDNSLIWVKMIQNMLKLAHIKVTLTTILVFSSILFILNLDIVGFFALISIILAFFIYYYVLRRKTNFSKRKLN